ncbi:NAD(P)H-binding protein [Amycolatopsis rubida]|uniref:NAD(P)H-binding protein n=1 Tax=Amycolatopsis rubida TaxID=112413 RepID=A0ABX0C860_9PSEU|nr:MULTISPECIES: NAD(P)H-binding protein [Amycolatopsis]MYW98035.1 NAD(P)H-binding protein [Amycolatopsis rubida]NEC63020.1 NAD(P)H-binding protein [Amycolatopsis rubida]OAP25210.1 NAD(P)H azoreductase [Amycolatopsis sp. M39]
MTVLVTGATGNVGRLVVDELVARGVPVRALTVDPERAALPDGVEVAVGSLAKPSTLPAALAGVEAVYLAPYPRTVSRFCELASAAGIPRVVALSGSSVGDTHPMSSGHGFAAVEAAVRAGEFDWTFVRPGAFMINSLGWAASIRERGEVRSVYPRATQTPVDLGDIAAVAAQVLAAEGHGGRTYEVSGPEGISLEAMAAAIGGAVGKALRFVELTPEEQIAEWVGAGYPEGVASWLLENFAVTDREPQVPTGVVEELLGRDGVSFAEWAKVNGAAFS